MLHKGIEWLHKRPLSSVLMRSWQAFEIESLAPWLQDLSITKQTAQLVVHGD